MSTTISSTQVKTIPEVSKLQNEERPHNKLVRTSSIEKIKRFNNYICSQHYYILPALLSWQKSSKSNLHSSTEKTIFFFRSLLFNSFVYKLFVIGANAVLSVCHATSLKYKELAVVLKEKLSKGFESSFLLKAEVYLAVATVVAQILFCVYILMVVAIIPVGFFFLLACTLYISHLSFTSMCGRKRRRVDKNKKNK